ncbi:MAG TPA: hypothetical protein VJU16_02150 [Planctomycetota bacterium]|nr:hypothetical protein [Planctomycetota bacterium]
MAEFVTRKEAQRRLWTVVVCAVLSVIALAVGLLNYKGLSDEEKAEQSGTVAYLRKEVDQLQKANQLTRDAYRDFSRYIGWSRLAFDTGSRAEAVSFRSLDALPGVSPEILKEYLNKWVTEQFPRLEIKGYKQWGQDNDVGNYLTLTDLFDILVKKETELTGKIAALDSARELDNKAADDFIKETWKANDALLNDIDMKGTGLKDSFTSQLQQLRNDEKKHRLEVEGDGTPANKGLIGQVTELHLELTKQKNDYVNLRVQLLQQKKELETRINWIIYRAEEARERKEPDGEILAVQPELGIGFIDLVHQDRIFRGSRFKVYSLEKGGEKRDKGEIEVLEVAKDSASKIAVYSTRADDPIKAGDRIYNETFERGKARNIAIAGRLSGKLSNEDAIRKIKEFGDVYQERLNEKTNYLIVGEGYENDPNFKLSEEYGVKIMIEKIFHEYLGVPTN